MIVAVSALKAIKAESLRERVGQALEQALASGELEPGELVSVPVLAERFDVSATPVREALLKLASRGIVVPVRNRGFRVTQVTQQDVEDLVELRQLVEPPMVAEATPRIEGGALAELRALVLSEREAAQAGDPVGLLEHHHAIHLGLLAWCENPAAVDLIRTLLEEERLRGALLGASKRTLVELAGDDSELVEAATDRRPGTAAGAVRSQLETLRGRWAAAVAEPGLIDREAAESPGSDRPERPPRPVLAGPRPAPRRR
jgi:DNA-binding GntR family transcriptional regulator